MEDRCECRLIHHDSVARARDNALEDSVVETTCQTFKALGDPSRLGILWALEKEEMCVCDLAAMLGISESAVSHQLRHLRNLRLVTSRRDGKILYYRLADQHVSQLIQVALEHVLE